MEPMENENESTSMIRNQLLLIFATKGCMFLILSFIIILRYIINNGFFPHGFFYYHPYYAFYYLFACSVVVLSESVCKLCMKFTGCMVAAALIFDVVMQYMSDHYVITHYIVTEYVTPFIIITGLASLCFYFLPKPLIGYLAMTSAFITIYFAVEYISLNFLNSRVIMLLPDYLFFDMLEFVLQAILISIGYLIAILYFNEENSI